MKSKEYNQFIRELYGPRFREDKRSYDICLTCWQYQTPHMISVHHKAGCDTIRSSQVKNNKDFIILARTYNKINEKDHKIAIFSKYDKLRQDCKNEKTSKGASRKAKLNAISKLKSKPNIKVLNKSKQFNSVTENSSRHKNKKKTNK